MHSSPEGGPPRWVFAVIMVGAILSCGVYLGMMRIEGVSTGNIIRTAAFALLGALTLWRLLARSG